MFGGLKWLAWDSDERDFKYLIHHDLINIEDGARFIDKNRLSVACWFTHSNRTTLDEVDLVDVGIGRLDDLIVLEWLIRERYYYAVDEC